MLKERERERVIFKIKPQTNPTAPNQISPQQQEDPKHHKKMRLKGIKKKSGERYTIKPKSEANILDAKRRFG